MAPHPPQDSAEHLLVLTRSIALALGSSSNLATGCEELAALCVTAEYIDATGVYIVDHDAHEIRLVAHAGLSEAFIERASHYHFGTPQAELVLGGEPTYSSYAEVLPDSSASSTNHAIRALGVVPIVHLGRVIGALNVASRSTPILPEGTRMAAEMIGTQIGGAIARLLAEAQRDLLMRELDHRVRNNLSLVQALASRAFCQTDDIERFRTTFSGRIEAIARVQDVLSPGGGGRSEIRIVLERALAAIAGSGLTLEGPQVCVDGPSVVPLCLLFHELGSNALMHGALSRPAGRVLVEWTELPEGLRLDWREMGGPPMPAELEPGSGLSIVRALAEHQLGGRLELHLDPEGLRAAILLPSSRVEDCP